MLSPEKGTLLTQNEYGQPELPKKAERVYSKPAKGDIIGHYLDPHSGEVKTVAYRMPVVKKAAEPGKDDLSDVPDAPAPKIRPDVTGRGSAMIGDLRTDALQRALAENAATDQTLIALLVMALAGKNVSVQGPNPTGAFDRQALGDVITEGGVITSDDDLIRKTAREMLVSVLSCRDNTSNSGLIARIAGEAIGASTFLPNMATEEFLSCLSRQALERSAATEGVRVEVRVKDTRARMVERFKDETWHFPGGLFALSAEEAGEIVPDQGGEDFEEEALEDGLNEGDALEDESILSGDEPEEGGDDAPVGQVPTGVLHSPPGLAVAAE